MENPEADGDGRREAAGAGRAGSPSLVPEGESRARWHLAAVLAVAALVRMAALAYGSRLPLFEHHRLDSATYHRLGLAMAGGDWALGGEVLHMSPLYTAVVGVTYRLFGAGPWPLRILQMVLGLATVALLCDVGTRLLGRRAGLAAGLVAALYGPFVFYEQQLLPDFLATFLHTLLLAVTVRAVSAPGPGGAAWVAAGVVWGLCAITRANALLLGIPLAIVILVPLAVRPAGWAGRRRTLHLAALGAGAALAILPVTIRNRAAGGEWVAVTDSGGLNFYIGNGPGAIGTFRVPPDLATAENPEAQFAAFREAAARALGRAPTAREADGYWYRQGWAAIRSDPPGALALLGRKVWLFFSARELPNAEDYTFSRRLNPVLALPLVQFGVLAPLALVGIGVLMGSRRREDLLVALSALAVCAGVVSYFVIGRYRLPAVPALIVAAVAAVRRLADDALAGRFRPLAAKAAVAAAALPLVLAPQFPVPFDDQYFKLGFAYHVQKRLPEAAEAYLQSIAIDADNISAHKNLAMLLESQGRGDGARHHWRNVARIAARTGRTAHGAQARAALARLGSTGEGYVPTPTRMPGGTE